ELALKLVFGRFSLVGDLADGRYQAFPSGKSEVVPQERVAIDIDLGSQFSVAVGGDKEVNVRRTRAVPAQCLQHCLGSAIGRYAVAQRHDTLKTVAAVFIGAYAAAQIEGFLR